MHEQYSADPHPEFARGGPFRQRFSRRSLADFSQFSPKVGATYEFIAQLSGYLSYSGGFVVPTTSQLLTSSWSNPDLNPEKAKNYEVGLRSSFAKRRVVVDLSLYSMEITDNGAGIPGDVVEQIFDPFYPTRNEGTGLGLYICKELCEANNIRIEYLPISIGGSCFKLSFPGHRCKDQIP